ncbi:MAG: nucleotide exchange factor GrpE [Actinobacteria bacterium]|nr:nucleotide exchange factor GrpE [Actinomycetota bacterium]
MGEPVSTETENVGARADGRNDASRDDAPRDAPDERLVRALADLDNLRKRFDREVSRERSAERSRVASEWLAVVDNLELALQNAGPDAGAFAEGVRAVYEQALGVLARLGFSRFDDVGAPFEPARHDAVGSADSGAPAGTVVSVVRPGYGDGDAVLRPASVIVSRGQD